MTHILKQINTISRCAGLFRAEKLENGELGACHHSYIIAICRNPGITAEELSRRLCVNKSNVARNLSYLEDKGYVKREQSQEDKRALLCYPTEKMLRVLPRVREIVAEWNRLLTSDLSEEELSAFASTLDKIALRARECVEKEIKED
jgi:hypothetical protein